MVRSRRSDASRAASARVRRAGRSGDCAIGADGTRPRLQRRPVVEGNVGERKNPRDLRLAENRSSQPPSASRALVLQATSATRADRRRFGGTGSASRRSRSRPPGSPCGAPGGSAIRPARGPFGAAHPIGLAAPRLSVPTPRVNSHRLLGARRNLPGDRWRVNPTFPQVSTGIRRSRGLNARGTKSDKTRTVSGGGARPCRRHHRGISSRYTPRTSVAVASHVKRSAWRAPSRPIRAAAAGSIRTWSRRSA